MGERRWFVWIDDCQCGFDTLAAAKDAARKEAESRDYNCSIPIFECVAWAEAKHTHKVEVIVVDAGGENG